MGVRFDARDAHYYGGSALVAAGVGYLCGLAAAAIVAGLLMIAAVVPSFGGRNGTP